MTHRYHISLDDGMEISLGAVSMQQAIHQVHHRLVGRVVVVMAWRQAEDTTLACPPPARHATRFYVRRDPPP